MRLYRMELYKLCHKKMFQFCCAAAVSLMVLCFCSVGLGGQRTVIGGKIYLGYDAVRMERQIVEPYRGALTDAKVAQIVAEHGLPSEVMYDYGGWRDANCLNEFVTEYLSDGYLHSWDDYRVPEKVCAVADTELGKVQEITGKPIELAYTKGWAVFLDMLQTGMCHASILLLMGIAVIFSEESQTKMKPLLFTTQEGKGRDVHAKIAAGFALTILVYSVTVLLDGAMCLSVFGLEGGGCPVGVALSGQVCFLNTQVSASYMPVSDFVGMTLGMNLLALLLLCAVTMCVSAHCRSNFGAVTVAAVLWGIPMLIRLFFGRLGYFITSCMPIFLILPGSVYETISWGRGGATVILDLFLAAVCMGKGWQGYRKES